MIMHILIALAAGAASALMFASIVSGALVALLLFYLSPLPLMVAALGWGARTAAIGGIAGGLSLGMLFGLGYFAAFMLTVALPAWWLGHLALIGRPVAVAPASPHLLARDHAAANPWAASPSSAAPSAASPSAASPSVASASIASPVMEWYPTGRLLVWIAAFAALTTTAAMLTLGTDGAEISAALRGGLSRMTGVRASATSNDADAARLVDLLVTAAPAAAAIVSIMTLTLNLWLAAKVTATSGRLLRSWTDLSSTALPPMTLVALPVALAFCFVGGVVAIIAQTISAVLLMAYALTGLAALHALTRGRKHRALWLGITYTVVMVFGWPLIAIVVFGLADAFFDFRQRVSRPPPPAAI